MSSGRRGQVVAVDFGKVDSGLLEDCAIAEYPGQAATATVLGAFDAWDCESASVALAPQDLLDTCSALRDEAAFRFDQLTDLCGVDYLAYGQDEWDTEETSSSGFSRGVQANSDGRLPVLDDDKLVGIITDTDFVGVAINLLEQIEETEPVDEDYDDVDVA